MLIGADAQRRISSNQAGKIGRTEIPVCTARDLVVKLGQLVLWGAKVEIGLGLSGHGKGCLGAFGVDGIDERTVVGQVDDSD
ncbi:hypothetical protein N7468_006002 [Penicillium chermesinum]|uniref:Uncharacterized protein n=1 Tax=Penicillium chermesinum TaxID=63820 RepID=A0A9W9TNH0_9EURO|nr:uncharacterized protein N7468_006002 [Penicillium chermesinum]KAJ5233046.1 hypothetical protein N7468_006002 [Penicillium chermesinum]